MAIEFRERPEFILGSGGERLVAKFLQDKGFYVIPSYDYSGEDNDKAPKMQGQKTAYVIPDLDICRAGLRRWVEVKTKTEATMFNRTGELQHGIDVRHFESYKKVQDETGNEVYLAIYELTPQPVILIASLAHLESNVDHRGTSRGAKMLYWNRRVFHVYDLPAAVA